MSKQKRKKLTFWSKYKMPIIAMGVKSQALIRALLLDIY